MYKPILLSVFLLAASTVSAEEFHAANADELDAALSRAQKGDSIKLSGGIFKGQFTVTAPISIAGTKETIIDAEGKGTAITVKSPDVTIQNLAVRNWGNSLYDWDSGILISEGSHRAKISNVKLSGPGFGIRADHVEDIDIRGCDIRGERKIHVLDRGDGVFLKYVKGGELHGNKVWYARDGFYFESSQGIKSSGNQFAGLQYGIHFMYDHDDQAWDNDAKAVRGGYAIMNSDRVKLWNNKSAKTVEFGILMNVTNGSQVWGNNVTMAKNPRGKAELDNEGKALFIYGPGKNEVWDNSFEDSDIGVSVAMGGEGTRLWKNAIRDNRLQVRYVGTGGVEWSKEKVGNYWSSYQGWDLNSDGVGDTPYQPNDSLDRLFLMYPEARFLMDSPVIKLLRFLASQFEIDRGRGVTDSFPLMQPPKESET